MCQVISRSSIRKANERSRSRHASGVSMDNRTAQISCTTIFGTQTLTVSRDVISKAGRGRR